MGGHAAAGSLFATGQTLDDRSRLCGLDGGPGDRRSGDAHEIDRARLHLSVLRSDRFELAAYKGAGLSFRSWDGQLRQPVLLADARSLVSVSPQPEFLHQFSSSTLLGSTSRKPNAAWANARLAGHRGPRVSPHREFWPASAETIYVSNEKDNTITVIDGEKLEPVKTIPVGQRPRGILLSKDEKSLYICASDSDHIEVLDLATDKVARTLPSGADPEYFALDPAGKLLYVANEDNSLVTVIDIERGAVVTEIPVGVEPEGMGISPDGKYLVATSETTNMAHVIDTVTREIVANILVDSRPRRAVWTADGAQFWVSAEIGGTVSVVDAAKNEIIKRITFAVPGSTSLSGWRSPAPAN